MKTNISRSIIWMLGIFAMCVAVFLAMRLFPTREPISPGAYPTITPSLSTPLATETDQNPYDPIRLAWFYKPPDDSLLPALAKNFDVFILTHKDERQRDVLKSLGVKSPIFVYLQLVEIRDPGSCTKDPQGNQVAYQIGDFCEISQQHPDWFLLDQNGNRIVKGNSFYMDPGNPEYQAFWLQRARALREQFHWDGIFIDNLEASLEKLSDRGITPAKYPDDSSYQSAIEGFLIYLQKNYFEPNGLPVLANIISVKDWNVWLRYLQYLHGAMIEAFAVDWSNGYSSVTDWESELDAIDQALLQGKTLILVSQAEQPNTDPNRQQFALASYLLVANENVSFRYVDTNNYQEMSLYQNYVLNLDKPLGPRYRQGLAWRRDFANGSVSVNPWTHSAEIKLNP